MDCRLLLIVSLIVPVSSAITESHQQLRANSVGTITRTGTGCSTLQHASLLQIQENTDPGIPLFNITGVSDLYFMENHDGFELEKTENQSIWLIKANRSFDFESLPKQQNIGFKVHCEDSTQNGPYTVGIFVTDVYEPVNITLIASSDNFNISSTDSPVIVSVPEYTVISTPILYIAAETSIPIQEELHWTPTNNSIVEVKFAEGTSMIFLNLLKELEYKEDNHLYPITVGTEVDGHPDSNQAMQVTINVTDVDDKNPKFDRPHYTGFIRENAASNTQVTLNEALKARDQDFGINARINYEIPFTDSVYNINPSSGVISLKGGHSLDRENISVFTLVVRACQEDKPEFRCDVATVEISITDVNDNAPVMSQASYTASIPENMKNGQVVTWVNATDADEGPNAEFEYTLENCTKSFKIAQNGSIIVKNSTQLDMEKTKKFNCTVYAKESKTAEKKSSKRSSLTIYLTDVNDNNPKFTNTSYRFTVTDNPTEHTAIGQVNAKDADVLKSTNGNVTYELSVQKENLFEINDRTGELHSLDNPLYACKRSTKLPKSVVLAVTAADSPEDLETKRRTTVSVTVNIQTNLCPPVLSVVGNNVSDHSIPEDILPGSLLLTIQVFDADPDDSSLFFDISGDHEPFQLNKTSKNNMVQLSVSSALDRERKEHYSFTVQANDTKHVISRNFTFDITDVNDNAPVFSQQKYSVNVTEETTQNTNLTVQATDKDLQNTDNSKITYTLVSSKWSNKFTIDASSGALNLVKKIDADEMGSNKTLELVVIAKDQGIPSLNCTALIHVTVEDINDHAPVFSEAPQNLTFTFNETDQPQHFFTVKATDKDTDDKVFYKLTNATEAFYIDNRTGQLSAKRDLQRSDIGVVVIEAYNVKNYSNKTIQNPKLFIEINIKDINNNSPVFTPNSYAKNISEGSPVRSEIGSVKANDSDWSEEFGSVYYWITDGNSEGHFFLNELNGTLYLANHTDYEKETKYNLTVSNSEGFHPSHSLKQRQILAQMTQD